MTETSKTPETTTAYSAIAASFGMTLSPAWRAVTLQNPPFGMTFEIRDRYLPGNWYLECRGNVIHRDTGVEDEIRSVEWLDASIRDPIRCAEIIRAALIRLATHEIDEMLLVNGKRYRDPHR